MNEVVGVVVWLLGLVLWGGFGVWFAMEFGVLVEEVDGLLYGDCWIGGWLVWVLLCGGGMEGEVCTEQEDV